MNQNDIWFEVCKGCMPIKIQDTERIQESNISSAVMLPKYRNNPNGSLLFPNCISLTSRSVNKQIKIHIIFIRTSDIIPQKVKQTHMKVVYHCVTYTFEILVWHVTYNHQLQIQLKNIDEHSYTSRP